MKTDSIVGLRSCMGIVKKERLIMSNSGNAKIDFRSEDERIYDDYCEEQEKMYYEMERKRYEKEYAELFLHKTVVRERDDLGHRQKVIPSNGLMLMVVPSSFNILKGVLTYSTIAFNLNPREFPRLAKQAAG